MNNIQAMELASGLTRLITGMEDELLQNIAAYLLAGKIESDSAKWKIRKLAELGKLNKQNIATINSFVKDQRELVELTVKRAVTDAMKDTETGFRKAVMAGLISEAPAGSMEKTMSGIVDTLMKQAKNDLNVVNTVMLYKAKNAAHKAIYDATQIANKQDYLDILNKAAANTATGTESITAAVSHCLKEMADKGIPAFVDHSGREWSPEGYVGMCVRQTCKNTETKALFERMKDYDTHFIEVSSHLGARPKCAKDQGKIFDLNNGSGEIEDLNGRKITYYPWSSSSYGEPDGLFGINCHHHAYPFTAGISLQRYFPYDQEENDKRYKEIQQQRELERGVRTAKRQCSMLKDGDPEEFKKASVRLKERTAKLKKYCADHDLTYMNERTSVLGYGHSEAGKVTAAYKKALKYEQLTFDSVSGIMKEKDRGIKLNMPSGSAPPTAGSPIGSDLFSPEAKRKLYENERIISGNSYETAILYDESGDSIFHKKGTADRVVFTAKEIKQMKGRVLTHNHPSGSVFSPEDINILRRGKLSEIRACNGSGAYIMQSTGKWHSDISSFSKIDTQYTRIMNEVGMKYREKAAQEGKSILFYLDEMDRETMEVFSNQYGLIFKWEVYPND